MFFRNIWITFSALVIALCLSLYFQNNSSTKSLIWDQYKILNYNQDRSHSLGDFNHKIAPLSLEDLISNYVHINYLAGRKTRIMEIGTGNGRVLMELKKKFPEIELYGINKEKTHTFYRRESYALSGLKFNIFSKSELERIDLPYIVFENLDFGHKIPYGDEKFDIVFSQNTMSHIKYKFELWNEILRVLRTGGVSVHSDLTGLNVYDKSGLIPMRNLFTQIRGSDLTLRILDNPHSVIFKKNSSSSLKFPVVPHQPITSSMEEKENYGKESDIGYNLTE